MSKNGMLVLNFAHLFCRNKFDRSLLEYRHESNASLYSTYSTYGYHLHLNCIKCQSKDLFQYLKTLTPFKHASAWKGEQTKEQKKNIQNSSAPKDHAKTFQPLLCRSLQTIISKDSHIPMAPSLCVIDTQAYTGNSLSKKWCDTLLYIVNVFKHKVRHRVL